MVANRARSLGIMTFRQQGELANPMTVAMDYVKDYEKRNSVTMTEIDFANLQSPGSAHRMRMKQIYGLSDEAIDMMITAGMQNMQFRSKTGGRNINFSNAADLGKIGLNESRLGLQAARFGTTAQRREAAFFQNQEGAMVDRLNQERMIQEGLQDLETAFGDVLGPMHEFQRVLQAMTTGLALLGGVNMLTGGGGLGGGGGILGRILGGAGGAAPGAAGAAGQMTLPGLGPPAAAAGGMSAGGAMLAGAGITAGSVVGIAGMHTAATARTPGGAAAGILGATAGGAMIGGTIGLLGGPFAPITAPVGAAVGATIGLIGGSAFAAKNYFSSRTKRDVSGGYDEGIGMTDAQLIASLADYVRNATPESIAKGRSRGKGAGPKQRGRFDAFARRRGTLLAAALDEAMTSGVLSTTTTAEASQLSDLVAFFSSEGVFNDSDLWSNRSKAGPFVNKIRSSEVWKKYFGGSGRPVRLQAGQHQ